MSTEDVTPVRQQYLDLKKQYPNTILFFRLGDFYETFDEDAETVSRDLDIVLTSRPIGNGVRAPLAGIPYHAVDNYLSRLISKGHHVAIAEQLGDQPQKGIFPRKVVRVITPGTVLDPHLLPGDSNNYLCSVYVFNNKFSIATVDISTGEFLVTEGPLENDSTVRSEINRINPAEIILPEGQTLPDGVIVHTSILPAWRFDNGKCKNTILAHFNISELAGFGISPSSPSINSVGAILQYVSENEPSAIKLLTDIRVYHLNEFMVLDSQTRKNLELTESLRGEAKGSLLELIDLTVSPMGKRLIRQWISQPLLDINQIQVRQDGVQFFFNSGLLRAEVRAILKKMADIERLINKVASGNILPRELIKLRDTLEVLPELKRSLGTHNQILESDFSKIHPFETEMLLLNRSISDDAPATMQNTGIIKPGFSTELDNILDASSHARNWINSLEATERERTGIKTLKVGYNKVFGYYLEISAGQSQNAPTEYIRKQTLVNAERYITPEMKEYETLILNADDRIREIEGRLFKDICQSLSSRIKEFLETARAIAHLDCLSTIAETSANNGFVRPDIIAEDLLEIIDGRHPVVEKNLLNGRYVPNDIVFEPGERIRLLTGPNMAGKSTYLRQAAIIVLMAQMGCFVPASSARIGLVDRIFTRIGAQDEIHSGHSTFMVEMIETSNILHNATERSLIILDEVGRGTSTYDGVSIAWSVIEYIHNHPSLRSKTLFATHYHELTQLSEKLPGLRNYNVAVSETDGKVVFLHKIIEGGADKSYGIHVAQLAGLPRVVITRAEEILIDLEKNSGTTKKNPLSAQQVALFPETNPLVEEIRQLDINTLSPIEALNKIFEWKKDLSK